MKGDRASALLERLREASQDPSSEATARTIQEALGSREARAVARAAALAAAADRVELRDALAAALERLLDQGYKADPGCAAKQALCEALERLGHDDEALFRRAVRHLQSEPVYGGRVDTAVDLRGAGALALARLDRPDALLDLARLLADPEPGARQWAARALAARGARDGLPLLLLRILGGDPEPKVLGACFEAAVRLAPAASTELVAPFLDASAPEVAEEAALALGSSRDPGAVATLLEWCGRAGEPMRRGAALRALALSRREEAFDFLLERVREGTAAAAREALAAMGVLRGDAALDRRVREAAADRDEPEVARALREAFG